MSRSRASAAASTDGLAVGKVYKKAVLLLYVHLEFSAAPEQVVHLLMDWLLGWFTRKYYCCYMLLFFSSARVGCGEGLQESTSTVGVCSASESIGGFATCWF